MIKNLNFINRQNGYLDLDSYLITKYQTLDKITLRQYTAIRKVDYEFYCIIIDDEEYFFKPCFKQEAIKELLASKMLDKANINHVSYDLASIFGEFGVISKYYKDRKYDYVSGQMLISAHNLSSTSQVDNNLSDIWDILEIRYRNKPNKDTIIKNIMDGLIEKFMFDILIAQDDGCSRNWEIKETQETAEFVPIYDNASMLELLNPSIDAEYDYVMNIRVENTESYTNYSHLQELKKFLAHSAQEYRKKFELLMAILTPNIIKQLLDEIETELNIEIDFEIKTDILSKYIYNYEQLQKVLNEELYQKR